MDMASTAQAADHRNESYDNQAAVQVLLNKLDEAIDDFEQDRVQTPDEAWEEIDAV